MTLKDRNSWRKKRKTFKKNIFFLFGLMLFFIGAVGLVRTFFENHIAAETLPETVAFLSQTESEKASVIVNLGLSDELATIAQKLNQPNTNKWIGKQVSIAITESEEILMLAEYQSQELAEQFLKESFLIDGEKFVEKTVEKIKYKTPEFSSNIHYFFKNDWLIITLNENSIDLFNTEKTLSETNNWQKFSAKKNRSEGNFVFIDTQKIKNWKIKTLNTPINKALFTGFSELFPAIGFSFSAHNAQIIATKNIKNFANIAAQNTQSLFPELFSFIPKNPLFLLMGNDLHSEIESNSESFAKIHPQYGIVFKSVIAQLFWQEFGSNKENAEEFIQKLHGQYAIFSTQNKNDSTPNLAFVSRFGFDSQDKKLEEIRNFLQQGLAQTNPVIETVSLPNGQTRQELVASPSEIITTEKDNYFVATANNESQIAYGFKNGYLILSTNENFLQEILSLDIEKSLAKQETFKDFVLFGKSVDRYGIIDTKKISNWLNTKESIIGTNSIGNTLFSFFTTTKNPFFFQRIASDESIVWELTQTP